MGLMILLLLAGIHFMVMILAACYSVSDLWYRIGDFWLAISAKILALVFADAAIFLLLPADLQLAFSGDRRAIWRFTSVFSGSRNWVSSG